MSACAAAASSGGIRTRAASSAVLRLPSSAWACVLWPPAFYALLIVLGSIMLYELSRLCDIKGQPLEFQVAVIGVLAYVFLAIFHGMSQWEGVLLAFIVLATFWLGMYGEQRGYFARTAYTLLAVLYIGKLLTYFVFIREVPVHGAYWTVYVIVLIAMTDISAMLVGSVIGRHRLTKISPKKTVEGSLGALVLVTVARRCARTRAGFGHRRGGKARRLGAGNVHRGASRRSGRIGAQTRRGRQRQRHGNSRARRRARPL